MPDIALALGGGGAAGLGHIPVLEAFDELGVVPVAIAGTSMGALVGAGYASGMTGAEIRDYVTSLARNPVRAAAMFWGAGKHQPLSTFAPTDPVRIVKAFLPDAVPSTFDALHISFCAVATDYHAQKEAHLISGDVRSAVAASIAIPGVFSAVERDGRIYVDGGVTNNLPFDILPDTAATIAVDVFSQPPNETPSESQDRPSAMAVSMGAMRIMIRTMIDAKMKAKSPTVVIEPASYRFGPFDFLKASKILEAAEPAKEETKRALEKILS